MPKPSRAKILQKVVSHLKKDKLEHFKEANKDEALSAEVKQKEDRETLKTDLLRKGMISKEEMRPGVKKAKKAKKSHKKKKK